MSYKSRPEGWIMGVCLGHCKFKGGNCPLPCFNKSKFEDCRDTCVGYGFKCVECYEADCYEEKKSDVG